MPKNNLVRINNNLVFLFLLFIAVLAAYANTFRNEFAWDDQFFIVDNIHTRSLESLHGWGDDLVHDYLKGIEIDGRLGLHFLATAPDVIAIGR